MNKTAIKNFAIAARRKLIDDTKLRASMLGITENGASAKLDTSTAQIEYYVDDRNPITGSSISKRAQLVEELSKRVATSDPKTAFNDLVEEVAYTWFNRLIAIRFMEVNDYLPSRTRVLSSSDGRNEPDIMLRPKELEEFLGHFNTEEVKLIERAQDTEATIDMDRLYRMLFIKQANALNDNLPHLFEKTNDYAELLFTPNYHDGVIKSLITDIPETDFDVSKGGQVEIIGWLYQYYNTEPKDLAISSPKSHKFRDVEIASATQIFTPDWIVKYMVENSLGKLWITHLLQIGDQYTESEIAHNFGWNYYMSDAQQTDTTLVDLKLLNKSLEKMSPLDIKIIDPAMGSGHILVYAFEILMDIYKSEGYSKRIAASEIVEHNINGLDIDTRAFQLSYFALLMKARQYDRHTLDKSYQPNVFDVPGSKDFNSERLNVLYSQMQPELAGQLSELIDRFRDGDQLGALIKIEPVDFNLIRNQLDMLDQNQLSFELIPLIQFSRNILKVAQLLSQKYQVVITNPPYMGSSRMSNVLSKYAKTNYPDAKSDLFSMFIQRWNEALQVGGYNAMVTMQSWMFLSSFEKMRKNILKKYTISNLMHMENNVMGIAFGTAVSIFRNVQLPYFYGTYHQIKTKDAVGKSPKKLPIPGNRYNRTNQANFEKIPGSPLAYWANDNVVKFFGQQTLDMHFSGKEGLGTSDNKKFLRYWYELRSNSNLTGWFPYQKGGSYRKWFGNNDYYVNWKDNGSEMKSASKSNIRNLSYQNHIGITWSAISSGKPSFRYTITPYFFDSKGPMMFHIKDESYLYALAYLNSKVSEFFLSFLSPTLDYRLGQIQKLPYLFAQNPKAIQRLTEKCVNFSVTDWNYFERSSDFHIHPLLMHIADDKQKNIDGKLENAFALWQEEAQHRFDQLKSNEEELNRIFIDLYGLNDELTPEVADKDVSVRLADEVRDIKSFLSYFIGIVFGRYSLDNDGLVFAGGKWNESKYHKFVPNQDNLLVLSDEQYFDDTRDIIVRLKEFLSLTFGSESVTENMAYIASVIGKKADTVDAQVRRYFVEDFFKDHKQIYQKHPIYWEFNSGRQNGFKALMYLHRYDQGELAMIRTDYLHPLQGKYENRLTQLQQLVIDEPVAKRKKQFEKEIKHISQQISEIKKFDPLLKHLADEQISLNLDDGVLVNYEKLQDGEQVLTKL